MVWTKHDFEREVRRQLVELTAIRKRVAASGDVHERLDSLEESSRHLLRKLAESFDGARAIAAAEPGLVSLAAATRKTLDRYAQTLKSQFTLMERVLSAHGRPPEAREFRLRLRRRWRCLDYLNPRPSKPNPQKRRQLPNC